MAKSWKLSLTLRRIGWPFKESIAKSAKATRTTLRAARQQRALARANRSAGTMILLSRVTSGLTKSVCHEMNALKTLSSL